MTNLLVRNLPDDLHSALVERAKARGQSLQQYVTTELQRLVARPSIEEVLDRVERRGGDGGVGLEEAVAYLAEDRAER